MKYTLQTFVTIQSLAGGRIFIDYRLTNFKPGVGFRVLINGELVTYQNTDTIRMSSPKARQDQREGWHTLMTHNVGYGNNSVEISVLNENDEDVRARAEIKSIRMVGVGHGGATECI